MDDLSVFLYIKCLCSLLAKNHVLVPFLSSAFVTSFIEYDFIKKKQCNGILGENSLDDLWPTRDPSKSGKILRLFFVSHTLFC